MQYHQTQMSGLVACQTSSDSCLANAAHLVLLPNSSGPQTAYLLYGVGMAPSDRMGMFVREPQVLEPAKRRSVPWGPTDSDDDDEEEDDVTAAESVEGSDAVCTDANVGWSCAAQGCSYAN